MARKSVEAPNTLGSFSILLTSVFFVFLTGCQDEKAPNSGKSMVPFNHESLREKLAGQIVLFQHESVGNNILDGIRDIQRDEPELKLRITNSVEAPQSEEMLLVETKLGKNGDPFAKVDRFKSVLENAGGDLPNIAFLKLCYVDVNAATDRKGLLDYYKKTMKYLKEEYPGIKFLHVTVPLKTNEGTWRTRIKEFMGKDHIWEYEDNIARGKYNELLKSEYLGKEPVFDLATFEATYPDGAKETFRHKGEEYQALVPEYSTDGAHLNENGRIIVATKLLEALSSL